MDKAKEIRAILSGRVNFRNGAYVAADGLLHMRFQGVNNGSFAVSVFGVNHLIRHYEAKNPATALNRAVKVFSVLGQPVWFSEAPEEKACLVRPPFGNPSIMTLQVTESGLVLDVYTARTPLSSLSSLRAISTFERRLPEELRRNLEATNEVQPKQTKEARKTRKARKKAEKWAQKAAKAEKHAEKIKSAEKDKM